MATQRSLDGCTTYHCGVRRFFGDDDDGDEHRPPRTLRVLDVMRPLRAEVDRETWSGAAEHAAAVAAANEETKSPYTVVRCGAWACTCEGKGFGVSSVLQPGNDMHYAPHCDCATKTHPCATFDLCLPATSKTKTKTKTSNQRKFPVLAYHGKHPFWTCTHPTCGCGGAGLVSTAEFGSASASSRVHLWATREGWRADVVESLGPCSFVVSGALARTKRPRAQPEIDVQGSGSGSAAAAAEPHVDSERKHLLRGE